MHLTGMKTSPSPSFPRGRLIALIAAGLVLLILAGVGIYGLLVGPRTTNTPAPEPAPSPSYMPTTPGPSIFAGPPTALPALVKRWVKRVKGGMLPAERA